MDLGNTKAESAQYLRGQRQGRRAQQGKSIVIWREGSAL